jgi:hypothetical protein
MEIGEAIAVLTTPSDDNPCPFCASKAQPTFEEKRMVSDSSKLAGNLGGIHKTMRHPTGTDFDVFDPYYVSEQVSRIGFNAHHIIPGNASLGRCPEILEWMAGTASIDKVFYNKTIQARVRRVRASRRAAAAQAMIAARYPNEVLYGDPDMRILYSARGKGIHRAKEVSTNKVTGTIDYDVNDAKNGIWLPSNNAVDGWAIMADEDAVDLKKRTLPFPQAYAYNAMRVTKKQFHDAHEPYSAQVLDKLREISMELHKLSEACLAHENTPSKKDGPFPAPQRLTGALYKLAELIVDQKLDCTKSKPAKDWVTSDLADTVGERFS